MSTEATETEAPETEATGIEAPEKRKLALDVDVQKTGPCRRHVRVKISADEIKVARKDAVAEYAQTAAIPGFRAGKVPQGLVEKRFKKELADQVRQKLLLESLEQLGDDKSIEPIDEPQFDVASLEIPDEGDFEYEFDVEVRPEFDLPSYAGLKIKRPKHDVTDAEIDERLRAYQLDLAEFTTADRAASPGDFLEVSLEFSQDGKRLSSANHQRIQLKPILRLRDGEITGLIDTLSGTKAGDVKTTKLVVSQEAEAVELRGETIDVAITVEKVLDAKLTELSELISDLNLETVDDLRAEVRKQLERRVTYQQRQETRRQVLSHITASASWDLPESLVSRQVENALRREMLEMQQAGFSWEEIRARENELRQKSLSSTTQALKEHFVLDKIATEEKIEVEPYEIDSEIALMAYQQLETPRKLRARLARSGMLENLEAQIRERKAVDHILKHAVFEDVAMEQPEHEGVFALPVSVAGIVTTAEAGPEDDSEE